MQEYCTLEPVSRKLTLTEPQRIAGVESDENVRGLKFKFPKIVEGADFTQMQLRINFINSRQEKGQHIVTDLKPLEGEEGYITFTWQFSRLVTHYRGYTKFVICAIKTDEGGTITAEWNTALAQMRVLEGLEVDEPEISPEEKDVISQLISICQNSADEAAQSAQQAQEEAEKVLDIIPIGGTKGQVLTKQSDKDKDYNWQDPTGGGGIGQNGATFTPSVSPEGIISWTNDKNLPNPEPVSIKGDKGDQGPQGEQGLQGVKGEKGDPGEPGAKGEQGEPGPAGADGATGPQGPQGDPGTPGKDGADGKTPNIQIGIVETLPAGSEATVNNTGTTENPIFNFGIPQGKDGASVNWKLIHDTQEIAEPVDSINIDLKKPLKRVLALWKIVGDENTSTKQLYCFVNEKARFYAKQYAFQQDTISGGFAVLEETTDNQVAGYITTSWNAAGFAQEFLGQWVGTFSTTLGVNRLNFGGGHFGAGSRIIIYGVEK